MVFIAHELHGIATAEGRETRSTFRLRSRNTQDMFHKIRHNATTVLVKPVIFAELKTGVFTLEAASAFLEQAVRRGQGNKIVIAIVIELAGFFLKLCSLTTNNNKWSAKCSI